MIYALIVVYNKKCKNSSSIQDIIKYAPDINIIVYDNSKLDYGNKEFCIKNNIIYFTQNKNVGISKAYNYVIQNTSLNKNDYLVMLDDDTHLNKDYFIEMKNIVKKENFDVILPIVIANNKILSPYNFYMGCRSKMISERKNININKVSGINSGMIIKRSIFDKIKYNEKLFLDYVDYDFMRQVHNVSGRIYIMKSSIDQDFQYFNYKKTNINSALFRFEIDMHDYKVLCKETKMKHFFYIHALKFGLKQTINYKSFKFISLFFKNIINS